MPRLGLRPLAKQNIHIRGGTRAQAQTKETKERRGEGRRGEKGEGRQKKGREEGKRRREDTKKKSET